MKKKAQKLSLTATSGSAGGDTFWIQKPFFQKYHIPDSYILFFRITIASSIIRWCWQQYFFDTQNFLPKNIIYQFLCDIYFLYHCRSQLHHMMLAAIVFGYKNLSSKSIIYQIPTYFFFVSLSLVASSDVAGSDTFSIPEISFRKVSHTNSCVTFIFCIIVARSYITWCWRRYFFDTHNIPPNSINYQFLCISEIMYHYR